MILYGVFIVDSTVTLFRRMFVAREKFYEAHRSHTYQILSRRFNSHQKVTLGVMAINILWLLPLAFLATSYSGYGWFCIATAYFPLIAIAVNSGAGIANS